jgi:prepilin-type N-terminal cleavage/methylation domain-containing protein
MDCRTKKRICGFSMLELLVAMALGLIVLAAAVKLYTQGVNATWTVSQRAQLQQDFRAAEDMLTRDLSLAGSGLGNNVQIALPYGTGTLPVYGCDQTPKCYLNGVAAAYPTQGAQPYLYGLIPGWKFGPTLNAAQGPTDTVTVAYTDPEFYLGCYTASVTNATSVTFSINTTLATCVLPSGMAAPQAINDPVVGLTPGDLVWFTVTTGSGTGATTASVIGEVTSVATGAIPNTYVVGFATGDPLKMNQAGTSSGGIDNVVGWNGTASRILVITYYIDDTVSPPRLMRQVSGHKPIPVAENVVYLQLSYDLYDSSAGTVITNQADGGASQGLTPNQITKINILHMAMSSSMKGAKGGYQGLDLQTSVSARDLTFRNNYPQ